MSGTTTYVRPYLHTCARSRCTHDVRPCSTRTPPYMVCMHTFVHTCIRDMRACVRACKCTFGNECVAMQADDYYHIAIRVHDMHACMHRLMVIPKPKCTAVLADCFCIAQSNVGSPMTSAGRHGCPLPRSASSLRHLHLWHHGRQRGRESRTCCTKSSPMRGQ